MARREYYNPQLPPSTEPIPIHHFPFTQNATDVVGDWGSLDGSCSGFSDEGAFFDNDEGFSKSISELNEEFVVIDFEFKTPIVYTSGVYSFFRVEYVDDGVFINTCIAPDWDQEFNCAIYPQKNTYTSLSLYSIPIIANHYHRVTIRQNIYSNTCDLFIDGVHRKSGNLCISSDSIANKIYIGRISGTNRKFSGHIRNFRFYNIELTNEQIALL